MLVTRDPAPPVSWTLFLLVPTLAAPSVRQGGLAGTVSEGVHAANSEGGKSENTNRGLVMLHEKKKRRQKQRILKCPVTFSSSVVDDDEQHIDRTSDTCSPL